MDKRILLIEDDQILSRLVAQQLRSLGHEVTQVGGWMDADAHLAAHEPHLIITDVKLPDGDSLTRLPALVGAQPVIILTAYGSVRDAVAAMKAGAYEYLLKPVSPEELTLVVGRALDDADLRSDHQFCAKRLKAQEGCAKYMIGVSAPLMRVKETISVVASSDITVLIQGESGAGKELVARALHEQSGRAGRNFVAMDCCTLQEKLFESELFGHERGSFTGADKQKRGLIEGAEGGTLFLDEIGEIEPPIQAKLLRVLETGTFRRVGGTRDLQANVRIVAATNRDLAAMGKAGTFRSDLYYRLSAFVIDTPPLRDRRDDIPYLVAHFVQNHNFSRRIDKRVSNDAIRRLVSYDWPGNVRELRNVIERAIILSRDTNTIRPEHLAFGASATNAKISVSFDTDPTLDQLQAEYLKMQLRKFSGHRAKVAEVLDISERNVYRLIQRYKLTEKLA
jgi:DNA-binding NtrC family response regulator